MTEAELQRAIIKHLKTRAAKGVVWFHVPNGGYRRRTEAAILNGLGTKAGIPDLCFIHLGAAYFLELKSGNGKLTEKQVEMIDLLSAAGARTGVANNLDGALLTLESWGILRGRAS